MIYEIKYKCKLNMFSSDFPVLYIKFRKNGDKSWTCWQESLDAFASLSCPSIYRGYICVAHVYTETRAELFDKALCQNWKNNMDKYVQSIVSRIVSDRETKQQHKQKAESLIQKWITDDWKHTEVSISNGDSCK